jgi:hypothetical protein
MGFLLFDWYARVAENSKRLVKGKKRQPNQDPL